MKTKEILTIVLIAAAGIYFAMNTNTAPNQVTITGEITNPRGESVAFSNQDTSYSTSANENGTFSISFNLDSATFLNFGHGVEVTAMYVKPGDKINLTIDTKLFDETIKYEGSEASSFLAEVYLLKENRDFFGKEYYLSNAEEYKATLDSFKSDVMKKFNGMNDSIFIKDQIDKIDKGISSYTSQQQKNLKNNTEDVRLYMWETREIAKDFNFYAAIDSLNIADFNSMTKQYAEAFESSLNKVTEADFLITEKERIKKTTDSWLARKTAVDNMPKEGEPAIDFNYPDIEGNKFSLAIFKGNLVYVDVWATWCGPCKAEIPSLQKLETDYHGKDITFMSVSVDTDKEAWEKMVADKELGGVQLWADGWSKITKDYAIFGIPRFMLFDAEGNVISTNAPRPSSEEIRELIEANL
jgi:thiol-disulfide isomerase/thioredoxin